MKITIMTIDDFTECNEGITLQTKVFPGHLNESEMTAVANTIAENDDYDPIEKISVVSDPARSDGFHAVTGHYHNFECDGEPVSVSIGFEFTKMSDVEDFIG